MHIIANWTNHFLKCAKICSKNLDNNETFDNDQQDQDPEIDYEKSTNEYNTFVNPFKTRCPIDYARVGYVNKQPLDFNKIYINSSRIVKDRN